MGKHEDERNRSAQETATAQPIFISSEHYAKSRRKLLHVADVTGRGEDLYIMSGNATLVSAGDEALKNVVDQARVLSATHVLATSDEPHRTLPGLHTTQASLYRQRQRPQPRQ